MRTPFHVSEFHGVTSVTPPSFREGERLQWADPGWARAWLMSQPLDTSTSQKHSLCSPYSFVVIWNILLQSSFLLDLIALSFLKCECDYTFPSRGHFKIQLSQMLSINSKCNKNIYGLPRMLKDKGMVRSLGKTPQYALRDKNCLWVCGLH